MFIFGTPYNQVSLIDIPLIIVNPTQPVKNILFKSLLDTPCHRILCSRHFESPTQYAFLNNAQRLTQSAHVFTLRLKSIQIPYFFKNRFFSSNTAATPFKCKKHRFSWNLLFKHYHCFSPLSVQKIVLTQSIFPKKDIKSISKHWF